MTMVVPASVASKNSTSDSAQIVLQLAIGNA